MLSPVDCQCRFEATDGKHYLRVSARILGPILLSLIDKISHFRKFQVHEDMKIDNCISGQTNYRGDYLTNSRVPTKYENLSL